MSGKAKEPYTAGCLVNLVNLVAKNFLTRKQFDGCATEKIKNNKV